MNQATAHDQRRADTPMPWPRISVLLPVHDPDLADLERAVASVRAQVWPNLELCIVDDGSRRPEIRTFLDDVAARDDTHLVRHDEASGISAATNAAIALASGDFLLLLDHDDALAPDATGWLIAELRRCPDADLVYSDHDLVDVEGERIGLDLKPGWSPELLLSYMYVGHLKLIRASTVRRLGGYREGFEGAADFDFALRLAELEPRAVHVPRVLYHWRAAERSIARDAQLKDYAFESGRRALQSALDRRGIEATAEWPGWAKRAGIGVFHIAFQNASRQDVAVVIHGHGTAERAEQCIRSLRRSNGERDLRIVAVDPEASAEDVNHAVRSVDADWVVLLDGDLIVTTPGWIDELLGFAMLDGVGAVGAKIVREDGRILDAGTVLGIGGGAASAFADRVDVHVPLEHGCYAHTPRNCSGVSMRAMVIRRDRFLDLGGFDASLPTPDDQALDLSLRLREKGYRIVLNPYAEAMLPADVDPLDARPRSRGVDTRKADRDPYYHPAFTRLRADFSLRTRRIETTEDGVRLDPAAADLEAWDPHEIVRAQEQRIDELEQRLAAFEAMAGWLDRLTSNRVARRLLRSSFGARLRGRLSGTRAGRVLKRLLGRPAG